MSSTRFLFPARPSDAHVEDGYVYVLEFDNGTIKVGMTSDPHKRLNTHLASSRKFGVPMKKFFVSDLHRDYRITEKKLINFCKELTNEQSVGEYFQGANFDTCVDFIHSLDLRESTESEKKEFKEKAARNSAIFGEILDKAFGKSTVSIEIDKENQNLLFDLALNTSKPLPDLGGGMTPEKQESWIETLADSELLAEKDISSLTVEDILMHIARQQAKVLVQSMQLRIYEERPEYCSKLMFSEAA